jgi:hypothetical protein
MVFVACVVVAVLATWASRQMSSSSVKATVQGSALRRKYLLVTACGPRRLTMAFRR